MLIRVKTLEISDLSVKCPQPEIKLGYADNLIQWSKLICDSTSLEFWIKNSEVIKEISKRNFASRWMLFFSAK